MAQKGARVVALLSADDDEVRSFGWGTFEGYAMPIESAPTFLNPKIRLDTREVVWGYECWWNETTEAEFAAYVGDRRVIQVTRTDLKAD